MFVNVGKRLFKEEKLDLYVDLRRETNKTSADTKASTRASRGPNTRGIDVKDGKCGKSSDRDHADFRHLKSLSRENVGRDRNSEAFKGI
ncbi:MAG: hypothetical protein RLZZ479_1299, partial [Bacteroidota bacterium]